MIEIGTVQEVVVAILNLLSGIHSKATQKKNSHDLAAKIWTKPISNHQRLSISNQIRHMSSIRMLEPSTIPLTRVLAVASFQDVQRAIWTNKN